MKRQTAELVCLTVAECMFLVSVAMFLAGRPSYGNWLCVGGWSLLLASFASVLSRTIGGQ